MESGNQREEKSWEMIQEELADKTGLAIVVVEGEGSQVVSKANNNSICEILYASSEFAPRCAEYCGKAFEQAMEAGKTIAVKCHADLNYQAVPIKAGDRQLVAIVGRTFLKSEDYRQATERALTGDWQQFSPEELFKNTLLTSSAREIEQAVKRLEKLTAAERTLFAEIGREVKTPTENPVPTSPEEGVSTTPESDELTKMIELFHQAGPAANILTNQITEKTLEETEELAAWRSLFGSLLELNYQEACVAVLKFLAKRYELSNIAWLERRNNTFEAVWTSGSFKGQQLQITIPTDDDRLYDALQRETSLEFRGRKTEDESAPPQNVNLFPATVGGLIHSAVMIGDRLGNEKIKRQIARFIRAVAAELEILRLREEIERQSWITKAVQRLNETLKKIDSEDFWTTLAQISAELMRAEQGSLLIFDDNSSELVVKAAIGSRADLIKKEDPARIGERVAQNVFSSGRPLVISDAGKAGLKAPPEWNYKTDSFISYPIIIGGRKIGVLNVTDKIDGGTYNETDLELLNTLIPQIAVAIDRTSLIQKAGEFEQLSITDPLTGLVNRRYLEERLAEEIKRSQRHGYPLSFMMIDADEFKSYNDTFGHPEGDIALQIIGQCLKAALRGADIPVRYGGEEFSILLPQTTSSEALTIAERVRQKVETTRFPSRQVTVSIGVATCSTELKTPEDLIKAADSALYDAKRKGRNNVQVYQKPESLG